MIKPAGSLCIFLINTDCKEIYHGKTVTHKKRSVVSIYFTCTICTMRVRFFVFRCIKTKKQHWHLNAHIMKVCTPWVTAFKAAVMLDSEPFMTKNARAVGANQQFYNINKCMKHLNWPLPCSLLCELQVVLWWSGHYISEYQKKQTTVYHHLNHKVWGTAHILFKWDVQICYLLWGMLCFCTCSHHVINKQFLKNDVEVTVPPPQKINKSVVFFWFHFLQGLQIIPSQDFLWKNI